MRPLSSNRRIAIALASCASIVPGTAALLSQRQISAVSHTHDFATGLALGASLALIAASIVFLKRDRTACSRTATPGA